MISSDDLLAFIDDSLDGMIDIVTGLGNQLANTRPELAGANSPFAILTHCLGVMEDWGGDAIAGRVVVRDRAAEFTATGDVAALVTRARQQQARLRDDVADIDGFAPPRGTVEGPQATAVEGRTQGGALVHILRELAQHRGQMEITRDLLIRDER